MFSQETGYGLWKYRAVSLAAIPPKPVEKKRKTRVNRKGISIVKLWNINVAFGTRVTATQNRHGAVETYGEGKE